MSGGKARLLLRRKAASPPAAGAAAAVDERIEHQRQELVHQLERALLAVGRRLAVELRERIRSSPLRPKRTKFGGSVPPPLKKLLSALATFCWLPLRRCRAEARRQVEEHVVGV